MAATVYVVWMVDAVSMVCTSVAFVGVSASVTCMFDSVYVA